MSKRILAMCFVVLCVNGHAQLLDDLKDIGDAVELATIAVDVVEQTSYTLENLKAIKNNLRQLEDLAKSAEVKGYVRDNTKNAWLEDIRVVSINTKLYTSLVSSALTKIKTISAGYAAKNAVKKGSKIVKNVGEKMKGGAKQGAEAEQAIKDVGEEVKKSAMEETLVKFLLELDRFNMAIEKLVRDTSHIRSRIESELAMAVFMSMPIRDIKYYADRKNIKVKK